MQLSAYSLQFVFVGPYLTSSDDHVGPRASRTNEIDTVPLYMNLIAKYMEYIHLKGGILG